MINLDLMAFADITHPKSIVDEIIRQNPGIQGSVPIDQVAKAAGITAINFEKLDGMEGALVANPEKTEGIVVVKANTLPQRQRFTIGHELGHFMIPRHGWDLKCSAADLQIKTKKAKDDRQKKEAEANTFAANLLMPEKLYRSQKCFRKEPSIEAIKELAGHFDVSFQACANRYVDLHDYEVAVVFSHKRVVKYGYAKDSFPFWRKSTKQGENIPQKTLTAKVDLTAEGKVFSDESSSAYWFDGNRNWELPESVVEEVYVQENGYVATLLWFENEIVEVE
jgi:Zn-dependent peptidase ImmA (M78 family)